MNLRKVVTKAAAVGLAFSLAAGTFSLFGGQVVEAKEKKVATYMICDTFNDVVKQKKITLDNGVKLDVQIVYPLAENADASIQKKIRKTIEKQAYTNVLEELKKYSNLTFMYAGRTEAPTFTIIGSCVDTNRKGNILSIKMRYDIVDEDSSMKSVAKIINVNMTNGKSLQLKDVFSVNKSFKNKMFASMKADYKAQGGTKAGFSAWDDISSTVKANIQSDRIFFGENSVYCVFDDNTIAEAGDDFCSLEVPYSDVDKYIKTQGDALMNPEGLFKVSFDSNPTTGYSWFYYPENNDLVEMVFDNYVQNPAPDGFVGVGGVETFGFIATGKGYGEAALRFVYRRGWEENESDREENVKIYVNEDGLIVNRDEAAEAIEGKGSEDKPEVKEKKAKYITLKDYAFIEGKNVDIYLDKGVTYREDLLSDVENIMTAIEDVTGLSFYPKDNKFVKNSICDGNFQIYFGKDPFKKHPENTEKVKLIIPYADGLYENVNDCMGNTVVVGSRYIDIHGKALDGPVQLIDGLLESLLYRNSCKTANDAKIFEIGFVKYYEKAVAEKCPDFVYPERYDEWYLYDFMGTLDAKTAETICTADFNSIYGENTQQNYVGYAMLQYMFKVGNENTVKKFLASASKTLKKADKEMTGKVMSASLKAVYGKKFFKNFGKWYAKNHVCTNAENNCFGIHVPSDKDISYDELKKMLYKEDGGKRKVVIDSDAYVDTNTYIRVEKDVTLNFTDNGTLRFSDKSGYIVVDGILDISDFDFCYRKDYTYYGIEFIGDASLKIDGLTIKSMSESADTNMIILLAFEGETYEKPHLLIKTNLNVTGKGDVRKKLEQIFDFEHYFNTNLYINGEVTDL